MSRRGVALALAPGLGLAVAYAAVRPRSPDLAAQLFRAKLFAAEGFGIWDNWWYGGHHVLAYSVLFPPLASWISPQLVAAAAAAAAGGLLASALLSDSEGRGRDHRRLGAATWLAAGPALELYSGRLTFAFGLLPAAAGVLAVRRRRWRTAGTLAVMTALCSPVAALFLALAGAASLAGRAHRAAGTALILGALLPSLALALAFPEGGTEPFATSALWPVLLIAGATLLLDAPRPVQAGAVLLGLGCLAAYLIPSPVGGNAARLAPLVAGPLLLRYGSRPRLAVVLPAAVALLYVQLQAPVRDVVATAGDPSATASYYRPLLDFLQRQKGVFRVEVPFTRSHWEAYEIAPRFPLPRGWERQLDRGENPLFYGDHRHLSAAVYDRWLHELAVGYVAVPDVALDRSALSEAALIRSGVPFLRRVLVARHWTVYAVQRASPVVGPPAHALSLGANSLTFSSPQAASVEVRVRYSPYWALTSGSGCVRPAGDFLRVRVGRAERVTLGMSFALGRIGARSPRCRS